MKMLIWKELREMRLIPLVYAMLVGASVLAEVYWARYNSISERSSEHGSIIVLLWGIVASGVIPGALSIATEAGRGTLIFLTSLPVGRRRIWAAKATAGLAVMVVSIVATVAAYAITSVYQFGIPETQAALHRFYYYCGSVIWGICAVFAFGGYAISLLVSAFVDRVVTALILAPIITACVYLELVQVVPLITLSSPDVMVPVAIPIIATGCLCASAIVFCRGIDRSQLRQTAITVAVTLAIWVFVGAIGLNLFVRGRIARAKPGSVVDIAIDPDLPLRDAHLTVTVPKNTARGKVEVTLLGSYAINDDFPASTRDVNGPFHSELVLPGAINGAQARIVILYTPSDVKSNVEQQVELITESDQVVKTLYIAFKLPPK